MIMKGNGKSAPPILNYGVKWSVVTFTVWSIYPTKSLFEVARTKYSKITIILSRSNYHCTIFFVEIEENV
jgi:hypothetical protein